ncbi:unannotated protein [freshwater metagenome]|uniref:Unannotated protein n=1 Tax=freshwater metagenome TaxID=449393 RepID=A0A6J7C3Z0_9ZZZZ
MPVVAWQCSSSGIEPTALTTAGSKVLARSTVSTPAASSSSTVSTPFQLAISAALDAKKASSCTEVSPYITVGTGLPPAATTTSETRFIVGMSKLQSNSQMLPMPCRTRSWIQRSTRQSGAKPIPPTATVLVAERFSVLGIPATMWSIAAQGSSLKVRSSTVTMPAPVESITRKPVRSRLLSAGVA